MNVLVVEDDDDKCKSVIDFLQEVYKIGTLKSARSLQSGLRLILEEKPDLILLDMTMRNFDRTLTEDGGRPHPFAGKEILRQMKRHRLDIPVIIVTHFHRFGEESDYVTLDELKQDLVDSFRNYIGTVQYKSNVDDWKPALSYLIGDKLEICGKNP